MSIAQDATNFSNNLAQLQTESLEVIAKFIGVVGYVWLALVIWPSTGDYAPPSAWVGITLFRKRLIRRRWFRMRPTLCAAW